LYRSENRQFGGQKSSSKMSRQILVQSQTRYSLSNAEHYNSISQRVRKMQKNQIIELKTMFIYMQYSKMILSGRFELRKALETWFFGIPSPVENRFL